jgi:hypothetical protein
LFSFSLANFSFSSAPVTAVQTVNDALMASGRLPAMTSSLPKSFPLLLKEWRSKDLHSFRHFKFPPSENALKQAYSKRVYLFDAIVASKTDTQSIEEAAHVLEAKRVSLGQTMTHAIRAMKAADSKIVRRAPKRAAKTTTTITPPSRQTVAPARLKDPPRPASLPATARQGTAARPLQYHGGSRVPPPAQRKDPPLFFVDERGHRQFLPNPKRRRRQAQPTTIEWERTTHGSNQNWNGP